MGRIPDIVRGMPNLARVDRVVEGREIEVRFSGFGWSPSFLRDSGVDAKGLTDLPA